MDEDKPEAVKPNIDANKAKHQVVSSEALYIEFPDKKHH